MSRAPRRVRPAIGPNTIISQYVADVIDSITHELTYRERDQIKSSMDEVINENHAKGGHEHGFFFRGEQYMRTGFVKNKGAPSLPQLDPSLIDMAESYFKDQDKLSKDTLRIRHALALLIGKCIDPQEIRDALPDMMKDVHSDIAHLKRTRPEAWTLKKSPMKLHQYKIVEPTLQLYYAHRILI